MPRPAPKRTSNEMKMTGDVLDSGLWVPKNVHVLRHRQVVKTITLPNGQRAKVTIDDSGTTRHIETDDRIDAVVRPKSVRLKLRGV